MLQTAVQGASAFLLLPIGGFVMLRSRLLVPALLALVLAPASAHALTGGTAAEFTKAMMPSCIKDMKANQGRDPIPDAKINGYCSCVSTATAAELEPNEVQLYIRSGGKGSVHLQSMTSRINRECTKRYLQN